MDFFVKRKEARAKRKDFREKEIKEIKEINEKSSS